MQIIPLKPSQVRPDLSDVLNHQGIPDGHKTGPEVDRIIEEAYTLFETTCTPTAMVAYPTVDEFESIFYGEGENDVHSPLSGIYPHAEKIILFAATMGGPISEQINTLFQGDNYPLAAMVDSVVSMAADRAAVVLIEQLIEDSSLAALPYSPGYCGWHISGQKSLFNYLKPEQIGLTLSESYMMHPLKSVSGVILAGTREMHQFIPQFGFCELCQTSSCYERMEDILKVSNISREFK